MARNALNRIRRWLLRRLMPAELEAMRRAATHGGMLAEALAPRRDAIGRLTLDDVLRPGGPEDALPESDRPTFLAWCAEAQRTGHLERVVTHIVVGEAIRAATEAESVESMNYRRATGNGAARVAEEIGRLARLHLALNPLPSGPFDPHESL
jgi:hypothetical protein